MGWDRGRYCTRSRKVRGRVVRQYVGAGPLGELVAELDAWGRAERAARAAAWRAEQARLQGLDELVSELNDLADLAARAALVAAGFRRHKRGEWRRQRVRRDHPE
jgi:hypothetical protein